MTDWGHQGCDTSGNEQAGGNGGLGNGSVALAAPGSVIEKARGFQASIWLEKRVVMVTWRKKGRKNQQTWTGHSRQKDVCGVAVAFYPLPQGTCGLPQSAFPA